MRRIMAWIIAASLAAPVFTPTAAVAAPAAIITSTATGQRGYVDPVVSPGVRARHEHEFFGAGPGVTPDTTTSAQFRALPSTWGVKGNHTGFWAPTVYEDGRRVPPTTRHHCLLYYQPVAGTEVVPPENTMGVSHEAGWRDGTGGGTVRESPPSTSTTGTLVLSGFIRAGRDLSLTQPFPTIRFFCRYNIGTGPIVNLTLGGPVLGVDGAHRPEDAHVDYVWAWDRATFERFLVKCVRPAVACGTNPVI